MSLGSLLLGAKVFAENSEQRKFLVSSIILRFVPLLTLPFISRLYMPDDFGVYAVYYGLVVIGGPLLSMQAHQRVCVVKRFRVAGVILFGHISAFFLFFISLLITVVADFFTNRDSQPYYLAILSSLFSASYFISYNLMLRNKDFSKIIVMNVTTSLGVPLLQVGFSFLFIGYEGLVFANVVCFGLLAVYGLVYSRRSFSISSKRLLPFLSLSMLKRNISFSSAVTISGVINGLALYVPVFVIERVFGSYHAGLYSMASRLGQFPFDAFGNYVQDAFKSKIANKQSQFANQFKSYFNFVLLLYSVLGLSGVLVFPLVSNPLLGAEWVGIEAVFSYVILTLVVRYSVSPFSYLLLANGYLKYMVKWQLFYLFVVLSSSIICYFSLSLNVYLTALLVSAGGAYAVLMFKCFGIVRQHY